MDTDDHSDRFDHIDQSRVLRLLCVISGHHDIASVTLPWLLNYLHTITNTAYSEEIVEQVGSVMDCVQSIVEHLSVLCDDANSDNIDYFKPFLLGLLKLFIDPTLDGSHIADPHVLTNSGVLSKCAASLRVGVQGVSRCVNVLEYSPVICVVARLNQLLLRQPKVHFGHSSLKCLVLIRLIPFM